MASEIEDTLKNSVRYMAAALIKTMNKQEGFNENEREMLFNVMLNCMTNVLRPEYAIVFNEYILNLSDNVTNEINKYDLFKSINWDM